MLRDITLGQYYRADSLLHRLDPRVKLVATFMFIISLFIDKFIEQPDTIPALIGFFLLLIYYVAVANYPRIEATVYFRKNMKKFVA